MIIWYKNIALGYKSVVERRYGDCIRSFPHGHIMSKVQAWMDHFILHVVCYLKPSMRSVFFFGEMKKKKRTCLPRQW